MRAFIVLIALTAISRVDSQFWKFPDQLLNNFNWYHRQGKNKVEVNTTENTTTTFQPINLTSSTTRAIPRSTFYLPITTLNANQTEITRTTVKIRSTYPISTTTTDLATEESTFLDSTTQDEDRTTEEPRDFEGKQDKTEVKIASNISQNLLPLPAVPGAALIKPTKYHYFPHNQHMYLLPECAIQQVCNAVYVRLNWTQPLCACPSRYGEPCSASLNSDDMHTTQLATNGNSRALTLVKTCEPTADMRLCKAPRDWSLLALQNIRTGKSHYLVICRCTSSSILEGPMSHPQPSYASVPGIRVYGMVCVNHKRRGRDDRVLRKPRSTTSVPFPWDKVEELAKTAYWD